MIFAAFFIFTLCISKIPSEGAFAMIKRAIGQGLEVSAVGLGCMGLSQSYPPFPEKEESIRFLRRAVEMGADVL